MPDKNQTQSVHRPAGYARLIEQHNLNPIPNWHKSLVGTSEIHRISDIEGIREEIFPARYWPGETTGDHLEFALKYDGVNLALLAQIFQAVPKDKIIEYIRSKPTGKYARRLWFLYEFFCSDQLPIADLKQGNYIDLLEPEEYYTLITGQRVKRQRIIKNLPGSRLFCPTVRRTKTLGEYEKADLADRCRRLVSSYSPQLLKRALGYLYTKETKSSFEIEHIKPSSTRTERFVALLRLAETDDFGQKARLIELQNRIVDSRFQDADYRTDQNYVGQTLAWQKEKIHFIPPKPEEVEEMTEGLLAAHKRMEAGGVHPVIHAAVVGYGFVFLHPFNDGNGRIHRFLIHNILARRDFSPKGVIFPISAAMLKNSVRYDESLEAFSRHIMLLTEYSLDQEGRLTVLNDTDTWYRYIDFTPQAEALFEFIEKAIDTELAEELAFLVNYDKAKTAIQEIVDMPDQKVDLFIRFCLQNNGRLSTRKRESRFAFLTETEIDAMEEIIQRVYSQ